MKPNLVIPLASSYDQRFPAGDTGAQAGYDQRKVNGFYELVSNPISGKQTLMLSKRPGTETGATIDDYGSGTQVPYLMVDETNNASGAMPVLLVKDGSDSKAVYPAGLGTTSSATILSDANYTPVHVSTIEVSGTTNIVVQLRKDDSAVGVQKVYYSSDMSTWTEISDAQFTALNKRGKMVRLDGTSYILDETGIYGSDLNSISAWSGTSNYIAKASQQDYSLGLIPFADRILAFGEDTCESFYNAGNATGSPLRRVSAAVERVGLSPRSFDANTRTEYYCHVSNRLFFLGKMSGSYFSISLLTYNGSVFEKVSGLHEDRLIQESPAYGIFPVTFSGQNAVGILLTAPGAATARWLMFFPETRSWFEWESTVFTAIGNGTFFAGVASPAKLYGFFNTNNWDDDGTNFTFLTQFRLPFDDDERKVMLSCGVQADTVSGATLAVKFNDGGAATYDSLGRTFDLSKAHKIIRKCGTFRERYVQLSDTSNKQIRLREFYATIESEE